MTLDLRMFGFASRGDHEIQQFLRRGFTWKSRLYIIYFYNRIFGQNIGKVDITRKLAATTIQKRGLK